MVNSCRECVNCLAGEEQYCLNGNIGTYASVDTDGTVTQGGYSTHVVVDEDFVLRVPESIPYEAAAPLLCAGITTYSPLRHWKAGHYATSDPATFEQLHSSFDLIINTVSAVIDLDAYLGLLALDGTMVNVGAPPQALPLHVFTLFGNRRSFAESGIGGIRETQEMLDFCAEHGIVRHRTDTGGADQRGLRARPRLRRPLPLRHRHQHTEVIAAVWTQSG